MGRMRTESPGSVQRICGGTNGGGLADGGPGGAECCPTVRRGFLETWHSERAWFRPGHLGSRPALSREPGRPRPDLAPSRPGPTVPGRPGPASGASSRTRTRQCGPGPAPGGGADAPRAAANHRLWLGSLKKEEPAAVWLSAGKGSLRACKHTS